MIRSEENSEARTRISCNTLRSLPAWTCLLHEALNTEVAAYIVSLLVICLGFNSIELVSWSRSNNYQFAPSKCPNLKHSRCYNLLWVQSIHKFYSDLNRSSASTLDNKIGTAWITQRTRRLVGHLSYLKEKILLGYIWLPQNYGYRCLCRGHSMARFKWSEQFTNFKIICRMNLKERKKKKTRPDNRECQIQSSNFFIHNSGPFIPNEKFNY